MKRISILLCLLFTLTTHNTCWAADTSVISVTGVVKNPLHLTIDDLRRFQPVNVRSNEVLKDKGFNGIFDYQGVPLKSILELAVVEKESKDFNKPIDLAVLVRNREGRQVALSWGEVMYRNGADMILAFGATPVITHDKCCAECHTPEVAKNWFKNLKRQATLPKLVPTSDFYTDRALEEVVAIEVIDLNLDLKTKKMDPPFSSSLTIGGRVNKSLIMTDLSTFPHLDILAKQVGPGGMGYHGIKRFSGVSIVNLLEKAGIKPELDSVFMISSPDGYRSLISYGELFLGREGRQMLIADSINGQPIEKDGKFHLMLPDDLVADRWVNAVGKIEAISLKRDPKVYVISTGCGDTSLITLQAVSYLNKADVILCSPGIVKRLAKYLTGKPEVIDASIYIRPDSDPSLMTIKGKSFWDIPREERRILLKPKNAEGARLIRDRLAHGKTVALLENGDPTIYGSLQGIIAQLPDVPIEFIPGLSSFNAANAMIGKDMTCRGSTIISSYDDLKGNTKMLKEVAENGDTLVIFMGIMEIRELVRFLREYYPENTPVNLAYKAGSGAGNRLYKTTLDKTAEMAEKEPEKHLGLIYVGPCLK